MPPSYYYSFPRLSVLKQQEKEAVVFSSATIIFPHFLLFLLVYIMLFVLYPLMLLSVFCSVYQRPTTSRSREKFAKVEIQGNYLLKGNNSNTFGSLNFVVLQVLKSYYFLKRDVILQFKDQVTLNEK